MIFNKTKLAMGVAAASLSFAFLAPQAQADTDTAAQADVLTTQLQQMSSQMQAIQAELDRVKAAANTSAEANTKVKELDEWMASVKSTPEHNFSKDNLVAIRGGWEVLDSGRGSLSPSLTGNALLVNNGNPQGYYFGGAFDYNVNNDLFGLMDNTSFMVELGVEYSQFGTGKNTLTGLTATDSRLRINASPKIKFMHGSKFRPWLIPVGLDINILGVPSNSVSVLNSGMQFGAGAEYDVWRGIVLGADTRYHYATSTVDGVSTSGVSIGGYLGFKF